MDEINQDQGPNFLIIDNSVHVLSRCIWHRDYKRKYKDDMEILERGRTSLELQANIKKYNERYGKCNL